MFENLAGQELGQLEQKLCDAFGRVDVLFLKLDFANVSEEVACKLVELKVCLQDGEKLGHNFGQVVVGLDIE